MKKKEIKIPDFPMAVACAKDWTLYNEQKPANDRFDVSIGYVIGFLVKEDDEKVVLSANVFTDGQVRETTVIPKENIIFIKKLYFGGRNAKGI